MSTAFPFLALLGGYLIGSLAFAVIVSRAMRLDDPRTYGSGNPGATNVLRSGNKLAATVTLMLDAAKGFVAVALASWLGQRSGLSGSALEWAAGLAGLGAFAGHLWPLYFRFKGGKGVATAAGVLFGLNPWLGLATVATWLIVAAFLRYSSLASLVAATFAPFYQVLIWGLGPQAALITVMSVLLVWRHAANISKLLAGTESKIGGRRSPGPTKRTGRPGTR
ncbi:MAG: glycerol-3-phosphate 1-O-acyltransferase PlsY [Pseudomonadota bacterium]|nr:glycerol-3-phosphate 1-O-acyltransferase PlsY [Pseudomonadota bacterium]